MLCAYASSSAHASHAHPPLCQLVQTIQAMLCAHFLGSADSSLPASLVAPPTATPSQSLPATQPAHTEGSTLFLEDAAGQSSRHSLEASEGENATGGGSGKAGKKGKASDFYYPPLPSHMMKATETCLPTRRSARHIDQEAVNRLMAEVAEMQEGMKTFMA
ncbi:unnamed protein product [Closterium sp. NIES-54]